MKHLVNWIEIPVTDIKRATAFYQAILNIKFEQFEVGENQYALFLTTDKFNSGALVQGPMYKPVENGVLLYLNGGDELAIVLSNVKTAGGNVLMEKIFLSTEAGYVGMFSDTEGSKIGLQHM